MANDGMKEMSELKNELEGMSDSIRAYFFTQDAIKRVADSIMKTEDQLLMDAFDKFFYEKELFSIKVSRERTIHVKLIGTGEQARYTLDLFGDRDGFPIESKWSKDLMSGIECYMNELEDDSETIWNAFLEYNEKSKREQAEGGEG
jgi:hypothetical protein